NALVFVKNAVLMVFIVAVKALNDEPLPRGRSSCTGLDWPAVGMFNAPKRNVSVHCAHAPEDPNPPSRSTLPKSAALRSRNLPSFVPFMFSVRTYAVRIVLPSPQSGNGQIRARQFNPSKGALSTEKASRKDFARICCLEDTKMHEVRL